MGTICVGRTFARPAGARTWTVCVALSVALAVLPSNPKLTRSPLGCGSDK